MVGGLDVNNETMIREKLHVTVFPEGGQCSSGSAINVFSDGFVCSVFSGRDAVTADRRRRPMAVNVACCYAASFKHTAGSHHDQVADEQYLLSQGCGVTACCGGCIP